jgi:hypothetical protein
MTRNLQDLYAEFPRDMVTWRPQGSVSKNNSIMALAYIDARDVMDRLDAVVGPENWQDCYHETPKGRVICVLSIRVGDTWISKSDGAGETQVEGEKGAISDALKRAAVKWGIGRYLYDLESPWVPCETYQGNDGKPRFRKFTADPWSKVRRAPRVFAFPPDAGDHPADEDRIAAQRPTRPVEPPHDPETGEVADERNPPPPPSDAPVEIDAESASANLQAWMDGITDRMPRTADKDMKAKAFWSQFVDDLDKYKVELWLGRYIESRRPILDRWQASYPALFEDATHAIARAYSRVRGEGTADFDAIGTDPVMAGEHRVA